MKRNTLKINLTNPDRNDLSVALASMGRRDLLELAGQLTAPKRAVKADLVEGIANHIMASSPVVTVTITFNR